MEFPLKAGNHAFEKSAGRWPGTIDTEKLIENIYADRWLPVSV